MTKSKSKRQKHDQSPISQNTVSAASSFKNESVPQLDMLRQDAQVQQQVQQRLLKLNELATSGMPLKIKSQRGGLTCLLGVELDDHKSLYCLAHKKKGFLRPVDNFPVGCWLLLLHEREKNFKMRQHMLDYLISLLDDSQGFSWSAAKASHAVLLCRMEQGEIEDYSKIDQIDRIRRAHAQRHTQNSAQTFVNSDKKFAQKQQKSMPCIYFNQNTCSFGKTNETRGVLYRHVCSSCFSTVGKNFPHMEIECRQKNKQTKNE